GEVRGEAFTVIARSNAGLVEALVELDPPWAHVVGGVENLLWLLQDAEALRRGGERERPHPDLVLARSWADLERLAEEVGEPSAGVLLRLAERFGDLNALAQIIATRWTSREGGSVVLSTAHRAKGREWDQVLLWGDFPQVWREGERERFLKEEGGRQALAEAVNLLYVATTRARRLLALPPELAPFWEGAAPSSSGREERLLQAIERLERRVEALEEEVLALRRQVAGLPPL
ncbi:3'-5' exonuclease, partial [Thermus sp.]|uniref:3'-5' exonuclease n=1 Tax=Thermus sp. TaxID=275 RepID=UPI0025F85D91